MNEKPKPINPKMSIKSEYTVNAQKKNSILDIIDELKLVIRNPGQTKDPELVELEKQVRNHMVDAKEDAAHVDPRSI